jgi:hypothetical protein
MRTLAIHSTWRLGRAAMCLAVLALALSAGRSLAGPSADGARVVAGAASGQRAPGLSVPLGWSFKGFFKSNLTRTRAIQGAALCMALGLFILMKKFDEVGGRGPRRKEEG